MRALVRGEAAPARFASGPVSMRRSETADSTWPVFSACCMPTNPRISRESVPTKSEASRAPRTCRSATAPNPNISAAVPDDCPLPGDARLVEDCRLPNPPKPLVVVTVRGGAMRPSVRSPNIWAPASPAIIGNIARASPSRVNLALTLQPLVLGGPSQSA